ncbi:MAG: substrate-binding domain-containing protein, partial [Litoreibacter sp.]|nr:substrate-binding domain-containing protein [Litoreibacter sp.]
MKKLLISGAVVALMTTAAMAQTIGVSVARFDDNGLTIMRNGMTEHAATIDGLDLQMEDAQDDVARQLDQINNFIASGVDAIIVNAVDTNATEAMSNAAASAGVPLVYVNRQPINMETLPEGQAFVASNEIESGTLKAFEICKNLRAEGKSGGAKAYMLMGQLSNQAAVQRSKDVEDVIGMDMCNFITLIASQTANWSGGEGICMVSNWRSFGDE